MDTAIGVNEESTMRPAPVPHRINGLALLFSLGALMKPLQRSLPI
jgi:hypothetical protein